MAPIIPHWPQPSHPEILEVLSGADGEYTAKSVAKVAVAPHGLFAKLTSPPCTFVDVCTYATVQAGRDRHMLLNSDLLYVNHSCEPSLIFDTDSMQVLAGPKGLRPGDELTFFYPSTEWDMAQPFDCNCGTPSCRRTISGTKDMAPAQLEGYWLSSHIRELKREQASQGQQSVAS